MPTTDPTTTPDPRGHATNEHGECASWCAACRSNRASGLNPDGTTPDPREIAASLNATQRWLLRMAVCGGTPVRGIGAGTGVSTTARALERRGLVVVDRRHWRDHRARATDLGRAVAAILAEGTVTRKQRRRDMGTHPSDARRTTPAGQTHTTPDPREIAASLSEEMAAVMKLSPKYKTPAAMWHRSLITRGTLRALARRRLITNAHGGAWTDIGRAVAAVLAEGTVTRG